MTTVTLEQMNIKELREFVKVIKAEIVNRRTALKNQKAVEAKAKKEKREARKAEKIAKLQAKLAKLQGPAAVKKAIRKPSPVTVLKPNEKGELIAA